MPTDYKSRANSKQKKSLPGYLWLLSGLVIGLFVAFIVYLDKQPASNQDFGHAVQTELEKLKLQKSNVRSPKQSTQPSDKQSKSATAEPSTKKEPKFNFYTLLPALEVLIPEIETQPPSTVPRSQKNTENTGALHTTPSIKKQYILQVGSFQNLNDAEKLKANLALLGLEASVQHITINEQTWHRVRMGPYKSKKQLHKNQKQLNQNNINFISMELK